MLLFTVNKQECVNMQWSFHNCNNLSQHTWPKIIHWQLRSNKEGCYKYWQTDIFAYMEDKSSPQMPPAKIRQMACHGIRGVLAKILQGIWFMRWWFFLPSSLKLHKYSPMRDLLTTAFWVLCQNNVEEKGSYFFPLHRPFKNISTYCLAQGPCYGLQLHMYVRLGKWTQSDVKIKPPILIQAITLRSA